MKYLEGKTVYLKPTGSNARRNKEIRKAIVVKVARVFITIRFEGRDLEYKFRYDGNRLDEGCNSGYLLFETEGEIEELKELYELSRKISDRYKYSTDYQRLSLGKLKKIAEILEL